MGPAADALIGRGWPTKTNERVSELSNEIRTMREELKSEIRTLGERIDNVLLGPHRDEHARLDRRVGRIEQHLELVPEPSSD